MSPTNFFLDFDTLFQINPAERFGTDELESFDEEFAALFSSFVNIAPLPSATPMVKENLPEMTKENLPEKTFEQTIETFVGLPQAQISFDSAIDNAKPAPQEFPTLNQILQPNKLFQAEYIELPSSDNTPIQKRASDTVEIKKPLQPILSDDSPKLPEISDDTPQLIKEHSHLKPKLTVVENKNSETQDKTEFSPLPLEQGKRIETLKESDLPAQTTLHRVIEPITSDDSKKIFVIDKDVKIEKQPKISKQLEFETKKQFFPIVQAVEAAETAKPKASANFQTVLENFTESKESHLPLKKIKLESGSTAFYEKHTNQENFANELPVTESQPITFEQFVENVPEQIIEPMIVLAKETGKPDATRTVKIKLNPEELGTVEINLEGTSSGKLHAEIVTETKTTEAVLNQNINELQKSLEHSGWQIETLTISCNDTNSGQSEKQSQQAEYRQDFDNPSFILESETDSAESDDRLLSVRA